MAAPHSLNSFVFCGLPLLFGFHNDDTEKSGKTIATPPKRGVPTGPDSGPAGQSSIRPQGVAIVGIYPCGKARKRRPGAALKEGRRTVLQPISLGRVCKGLGVAKAEQEAFALKLCSLQQLEVKDMASD